MRENRREGVGREVRKWGRLFFSSSYHRLILLAFPCRRRLVGRLALRLVACLSSCGARAFSFRRSPRRLRVRLACPSSPVVSASRRASRCVLVG